MKDILRILADLRFFRKKIALNIGFNLLYVFFSLFSFITIIPFVSILFGVLESPLEAPSFSFNKDVFVDYICWHINELKESKGAFVCLALIGGVYLFFAFGSALFRYLGMFYLTPIRNGLIQQLRSDLYRKITILPLSFFSTRSKGDLLSRMTADLADIEWSVASSLQMLVKDPLNVIFFLIFLIIASPQLVLFVLVIMPLAALLLKRVGASLKRNSQKGQEQMGDILVHAEETFSGIRMIKAFGVSDQTCALFERLNERYSKIMIKIFRRRELASPLTEVFSVLALILIVLFGGYLVISGKLHPGVLIAFVLIFARIISPIQSVTTAYYNLQKGSAAAKRILEIMDAEEKIVEIENPIRISEFKKAIVYKNVSFAYPNSKENVLKQIDLEIPKGTVVALVGSSGAGKTTLADLLPRFHDCEGSILIDGYPIKDLCINDLRNLIGIVSQESILFHDTIVNNIAFGDVHPDLERVKHAAKVAYATEFIEALPNGYYAYLGDRGQNLSGGQRQRICIARAIYKNSPILILDEATSSLDAESEKQVQEALTSLMQGRTSIVIAHRLSTIMHANKIVVMEKGEIVEEGTHAELIQTEGVYAKLIALQSF